MLLRAMGVRRVADSLMHHSQSLAHTCCIDSSSACESQRFLAGCSCQSRGRSPRDTLTELNRCRLRSASISRSQLSSVAIVTRTSAATSLPPLALQHDRQPSLQPSPGAAHRSSRTAGAGSACSAGCRRLCGLLQRERTMLDRVSTAGWYLLRCPTESVRRKADGRRRLASEAGRD